MSGPVWIEQTVEAVLRGNDDLFAIVAGRVYPLKIPQGTILPCVVFQRLYSSPEMTLLGYSSENVIMMVNSFGLSYGQAKTVAMAVRKALAAPPLQAIFRTDQDLYDDSSKTYCVTAEYLCTQSGGFCL